MSRWTAFKPRGHFSYNNQTIQKQWARLHAADCVPLPHDADLLEAWTLFHNGYFEEACRLGLALDGSGNTVANKATCVYAALLEPSEPQRLRLLLAACERATAHMLSTPDDPNAHYLLAYSLSRYSQGISVVQGLAQGLGSRIKIALETAIALQPRHADAHFALGAFHADIIDKVGPLIASMTYGVKRETSLELFQRGFALHPHSPFGLLEYANALLMLEGDAQQDQATKLYRQVAALKPLDAHSYLNIALAKNNVHR
jgi:tetratricopeptide (TPR) repeat protein